MYNIVYSSSNIYLPYCTTSIASLLENNIDIKQMRIFILSNSIKEEDQQKTKALFTKWENVEIVFIDTQQAQKKLENMGAKLNFNISSMLRVFIAELLPEDVEKALFIDSDTYVNKGICEFYDIDITNYVCGMCYNQFVYREMQIEAGLDEKDGYFNAGVILINLKRWREDKIQEKMVECYKAKGCNFAQDDQGLINTVLAKQTYYLPYKYNVMTLSFFCTYKRFCKENMTVGYRSKEEYLEAQKCPVVVHFNGPGVRPWERWSVHPYTGKYRKIMRKYNPGIKLINSKNTKLYQISRYIKHTIDVIICSLTKYKGEKK